MASPDDKPKGTQSLSREQTHLLQLIERAFDGVQRANGVTLHEADVIDDYGIEAQRAEARKLDRERRWQDVPEGDIARFHWSLSFFDPAGFRYYLPAYMSFAVRHWTTTSSSSPGSLVFHLTNGGKPLEQHDRERFAALNPDQAAAVVTFLEWVAAHDEYAAGEIEWALDEFWPRKAAGNSRKR